MKKAFLIALLGVFALGGCSLFDWGHNWRHIKSFFRDMHQLHKEIDRHFLNYDEENPHNY
ncbi:MAG: hypothetical protein ACYTHM_09460 [Planctomycetota bacterium]